MPDTARINDRIHRRALLPGVNLSCVFTEKFKTGYFSVFLLRELNMENAAKNALIPSVLMRGCTSYPDMTAVAARLGELYGANVSPVIRQLGELQAVGLCVSFADDRYLPDGDKILEKIISLTGELLLDPATKGGLLNSDYVASEKENLCERINAVVNNKAAYAQERMKSHMFKNENYGVYYLGTAESAEKITAPALTRHYKRALEESRIEMFYCGGCEPERLYSAVASAFRTLPGAVKAHRPDIKTKVVTSCGDTKYITEKLNVTQGNLVLGFRFGEDIYNEKSKPDYAAMSVFNSIYGGSINSKLFLNVREKLSLCYSVSSGVERHKGIMYVSSGIDFDKYDIALETILDMLRLCREGDISDEEIETAKKTIITDLKSVTDGAVYLDAFWLRQAVCGLDYGPEVYAALVEEVTREDVVRFANSLKLDTVYFLKGEDSAGVNTEESRQRAI